MDSKTFNQHLELLQKLEKSILLGKAEEYAHGDRLSNFYDAALFNQETPEQALWGMVTKHIIALKDFIMHDEMRDQPPAQIYEKLGDIRNYMYLLSAICYDLHPTYKEYFDAKTAAYMSEVPPAPTTEQNSERGGKI